jgi:hypothetical protein
MGYDFKVSMDQPDAHYVLRLLLLAERSDMVPRYYARTHNTLKDHILDYLDNVPTRTADGRAHTRTEILTHSSPEKGLGRRGGHGHDDR